MTSWSPNLEAGKPRYLAIADAISADLATGRLKAGDRLPPQRNLAWQLGVTIGTVTRAYQEASKRGLLSGEVGRGSYLREPSAQNQAIQNISRGFEPGVLNLQISAPPRVLQTSDIESVFNEIVKDPHWTDLFDYGPAAGWPEHRAAASKWLAKCQVEAPVDRIVLSSGAQSALVTTLATVSRPGETLLIEPLTYPTMQPIALNAGLKLCPLQADAQGIIPESIERLARRENARLVYFVPTFNNPTTITLSTERRSAIAEIAKRLNLTIIEDDVFRLLATDPPKPVQTMAPDNTYYITSLSKTMAPGLRLAFTLPPEGSADGMNRHQMVAGGRPTSLTAEVARRWIETGVGDRVLASIRSELEQRRRIALEVFGNRHVSCSPGAMYVWAELPPQWTPSEFAASAQAIGIRVTPGNAFAMDPFAKHQAFRACLGPAPTHAALREALERLCALIDARKTDDHQTIA